MSGHDHKNDKVRLYYFNVRARGEIIRWILTAGGANFDDIRLTQEEWAKHKPNTPLGQIPVLEWECNGKKHALTQTAAIARVSAHFYGLGGKTQEEIVHADEAFEVVREIAEQGYLAWFEKDPARKEKALADWKEKILCRNMAFLEKKLQSNGGKYIAGGECFTYADIAVACYVNSMRLWKEKVMEPEQAKQLYPGLANLIQRVEEIPKIKEYLAKRPATDM